jgi:hypothetical protein
LYIDISKNNKAKKYFIIKAKKTFSKSGIVEKRTGICSATAETEVRQRKYLEDKAVSPSLPKCGIVFDNII